MTKTVIYTNSAAFERAKADRLKKLQLFEDLGKEFHALTGEVPKDNLLRADAWGYLKNSILANYSMTAPKKLSFEKTIQLYEINVSRFRELCKDYNSIALNETLEVNLSDFQTFAENKAQETAFNEVNNLINEIDQARQKYGLFRSLDGICSSLVPLIQFNLGEKPIPSVTFIKSLK